MPFCLHTIFVSILTCMPLHSLLWSCRYLFWGKEELQVTLQSHCHGKPVEYSIKVCFEPLFSFMSLWKVYYEWRKIIHFQKHLWIAEELVGRAYLYGKGWVKVDHIDLFYVCICSASESGVYRVNFYFLSVTCVFRFILLHFIIAMYLF